MRIVYDHQAFSLQDAGGVSRYVYELARHLQAAGGADLDFLMGWNASVHPFTELRNPGTRVLSLRTSGRPGYPRYARNELLTSAVALTRPRWDIYHSMLYRAMPAIRARRIVATHHDCTHERFPELFWNAKFIMERKRRLFQRADAIICVSESSRQDLLHFYAIDPAKTHVVHHGLTPLAAPAEADASGEPEEPYLLYVGLRAPYKNFGLLLEAFARKGLAQNYRLLVIGGGEFSPTEQARIAALGLADRVRSIPRSSDKVLARAYAHAALFVYPSMYEGFGFPPLEAMSVGTPVLVNRTSSLPEVCGDAAFYFESSDADDLASAIERTLSDAGTLERARSRGLALVKRYQWSRTAAKTLAVYQQCLSSE